MLHRRRLSLPLQWYLPIFILLTSRLCEENGKQHEITGLVHSGCNTRHLKRIHVTVAAMACNAMQTTLITLKPVRKQAIIKVLTFQSARDLVLETPQLALVSS